MRRLYSLDGRERESVTGLQSVHTRFCSYTVNVSAEIDVLIVLARESAEGRPPTMQSCGLCSLKQKGLAGLQHSKPTAAARLPEIHLVERHAVREVLEPVAIRDSNVKAHGNSRITSFRFCSDR